MEGYYHCEECSALFLATVLPKDVNVCPKCGKNPIAGKNVGSLVERIKERAPAALPVELGEAKRVRQKSQNPLDQADFVGVQKARRKQRFQWGVVTMGISLLAILGMIYGMKFYHANEGREENVTRSEELNTQRLLKELNIALPLCQKRMFQFLDSVNDDARLAHVAESSRVSTILSRFYDDHQFYRPTGKSGFYMKGACFAPDHNERVINTIWTDGHSEVEASFIKEEEWFLDWDSFVRYSGSSWIAFLAEQPTRAEVFRLYVRKRNVNGGGESNLLSVQFYKPRQNILRGEGLESPEVQITADSTEGLQMLRAFDELSKYFDTDGEILPGRVLRRKDPLGMARIQVKLAYEVREEDKKVLVVREVLAADWLGSEVR